MRLAEILEKKKTAIVNKWFNQVAETYPQDSSKFIKSQKDPFANPIGSNTLRGLTALLDCLLSNADTAAIRTAVDPIVRIRAIQKFTPSQALYFIGALKRIVREQWEEHCQELSMQGELRDMEDRIDTAGLVAFDAYMECREKLYEIRYNEQKNRIFRAFERAGLVCEISDQDPAA